MTRINVGVKPSELNGKHLIAEHREIKRIPNCIVSGRYDINGIPSKFKLGSGHVKFFYDKQLYLLNRYLDLYEECKRRGYDVQDYSSAWKKVPVELMNDYSETDDDRKIVLERIAEKLQKMVP